MTETIEYNGWTIEVFSYPEVKGNHFVAECWGEKRLISSHVAKSKEEAISLAKKWCDENIPF